MYISVRMLLFSFVVRLFILPTLVALRIVTETNVLMNIGQDRYLTLSNMEN